MIEFIRSQLKDIQKRDCAWAAENSYFNYHTQGLHYLNLSRGAEITLKLYYIPETVNRNEGFLVLPHNHRYNFQTFVLKGMLYHYRFEKIALDAEEHPSHRFHQFDYSCHTKRLIYDGLTKLKVRKREYCCSKDTYYVHPDEIHTLEILEGPVVLAILQGPNSHFKDSSIFSQNTVLENDCKLPPNNSSPMTPGEYIHAARQILNILGGHNGQ